jgi:hypothetical protein
MEIDMEIKFPIETEECFEMQDVVSLCRDYDRELEKLKEAVCPVINGARESDLALLPDWLQNAWERLRYAYCRLEYGEIEYGTRKYAVTERWYEFVPPENRPPGIDCEFQSVVLDEIGKEYKLFWLIKDKAWAPSILRARSELE